ncbi:site-specific DNA-methyltransferase [Neobacillus muris]|uniref:site-specific DNA-methyltransferase n=1 Tax=Neobacillus muris TaxID=2941334 RepID=UPI00203A8C22|nr:site-specific DNA-methyltransferase [Neobacillus muris]
MTESYQKLIAILKEMFQLDQSDLDFGIYRIMNYKRDEIEKFLNEDLLPQVKTELEKYISVEQKGIEKELKELTEKLEDAGVALESSSKYVALKSKLDNGLNVTSAENEVYSHLANFFRRYYNNGDFISLRRYRKDVYALPYNGEEVKLHWANADQYYIKTAEYFRDYSFITDGKKVHFKLIDAETERDNNKSIKGKERRFVIVHDEPLLISNGDLIIRFEYLINEQKQKDLNSYAVEVISESINNVSEFKQYQSLLSLEPTEKNPKRKLIEKHLNDYTSRNTFDYFIHKDLGGFLKRELDFYIKNEVMFLDDIDVEENLKFEQYLTKIKVIKRIGSKIISFLEQIENFQKKLWLKKKFVTQTNYCITLDNVPEDLYSDIVKNSAQIEEWKRVFAIDEIKGDLMELGYSEPLTVDFLKQNPYLVLDTLFFDDDFKEKILGSIYNLDEKINGLLIKGENFQALNLIQERYKGKISTCYIDPPYNKESDEFIYKDNFKHSSWISLLVDRLILNKNLLSQNKAIFISIDDDEFLNLENLLSLIFGESSIVANCIWKKADSPNEKDRAIATYHEYIVVASPDGEDNVKLHQKFNPKILEDYPHQTEDGVKYRLRQLRKNGKAARREDRPNLYYPLEAPDGTIVYPVAPEGWDGRWVCKPDTYKDIQDKGEIEWIKRDYGWVPYYYEWAPANPVSPYPSIFDDIDKNRQGKAEYTSILGPEPFETPKPSSLIKRILELSTESTKNEIILDYFAGSGTTAQAVIDLNRETVDGNRKYILVEMGHYFDSITKLRVLRSIYSDKWDYGKPVSRKGSSHIFKYISLESYEDTLNNLEINLTEEQLTILEKNPELREQYMLSYMLNNETENSMSLLNIDMFKNPFEYKLKIANGLETQVTTIDLVETFNYLLGIEVIRNERKERYNAIEDDSSEVPGAVKLSSSKDGEYTFKEIEGRTLDGDKLLVIWRTLSDDIVRDNAALDDYFLKKKYSTQDFEFNRIYVNGNNNLQNLKLAEERWKVVLIEEEFKKLMFDVQDV